VGVKGGGAPQVLVKISKVVEKITVCFRKQSLILFKYMEKGRKMGFVAPNQL
jgi:hypothetical protein